MRRHHGRSDLKKLADDMRAMQSNTVWPDPLINSRGVDAFLWKGSPSPTAVQRVAAWLFGVIYMSAGFILLALAWHEGGIGLILLGIVAVCALALGIKTFSNGFAKPLNEATK